MANNYVHPPYVPEIYEAMAKTVPTYDVDSVVASERIFSAKYVARTEKEDWYRAIMVSQVIS